MNKKELKAFLDEKALRYEKPDFIPLDPIQIPHRFNLKEDIEIAGFLAATISWGNRKSIINSANRLVKIMGNSPYDFVMSYTPERAHLLSGFVHRTFNEKDLETFILSLKNIYTNYQGLEQLFAKNMTGSRLQSSISAFKKVFFEIPHQRRTQKHVSDPHKNSAAKRINMYLRWMVRDSSAGVDLGLWKSIPASVLSCPLDVHTSTIARKLGLLSRKQNDAKTLLELDTSLRNMDPTDPVKYDFALFGLGAIEQF